MITRLWLFKYPEDDLQQKQEMSVCCQAKHTEELMKLHGRGGDHF
jgi:hypothetical protein